MATYAYQRVSTARQADEGQSLATQERQIEGYCLQHGWELDSKFSDEGVSGGIALRDRPAGKVLLASLKKGDVVIASKLDRLFRSALDALSMVEDFRQRGVSLHLLDLGGDISGNGLSRVFLTMAAAFAEFERERIGERIRDVKKSQRKDGRYLGGHVPFGYTVQGDVLVEDSDQQRAIALIMKLHGQGQSLRKISDQLGEHGFAVSHQAVRRIIRDQTESGSK